MVEAAKDQIMVDSDGVIVRYSDVYAGVTQEDVDRAQALEIEILNEANSAEIAYLRMARHLSEFKRDNLCVARGYPSFRTWADSPDLKKLGYRSAQRLVQIADEAIPLLEKYGAMEFLPPVSTMGDLLPILGDDNGEEKFIQAVKDVEGMSNADAKRHIKEIRGINANANGDKPTFTAKVQRGDSYNKATIFCSDIEGDFYQCGTLNVKPKDWAQFEAMFNARFIEYVD